MTTYTPLQSITMATSDRVPVAKQDFLTEDPPIRGQNYCCLSFISPEDVIVQKEVDFFNQYLTHFSAELGLLFDNIADKFKDSKETSDMISNLKERYDYVAKSDKLQDEFKFFKANNSEKLEREYLERNEYRTSVRGIKIRGCYETIVEAQQRATKIKQIDPNFDVFVAQVGCWCPWAPNPHELQDQEFAETELNTLMKKYTENIDMRDEYHRQRVDEMKTKVHSQRQEESSNENVQASSTASTSIVEIQDNVDINE